MEHINSIITTKKYIKIRIDEDMVYTDLINTFKDYFNNGWKDKGLNNKLDIRYYRANINGTYFNEGKMVNIIKPVLGIEVNRLESGKMAENLIDFKYHFKDNDEEIMFDNRGDGYEDIIEGLISGLLLEGFSILLQYHQSLAVKKN